MIKNVTVHLPKGVFKQKGRSPTLCSEGVFPLQAPEINADPECEPQEGIITK